MSNPIKVATLLARVNATLIGVAIVALAAVVAAVMATFAFTQARRAAVNSAPCGDCVCNCSGGGGSPGSLLAPSALCNDSNVCTIDLLDSTLGTCTNPNAPAATACSTLCWHDDVTPATTCDGHGTCTSSNVSGCHGMCQVNPDFVDFGTWNIYESINSNRITGCGPDTIPVKPHFFTPVNFSDFTIPEMAFGFGYPVCYAQVCNFIFLMATGKVFQWPPPSPVASPPPPPPIGRKRDAQEDFFPHANIHTAFPCEELLDTSFPGFDASCIVTREIPVDGFFLENFFAFLLPGKDVSVPVDAYKLRVTGRYCSFHYACAQTNASIYNDPQNMAPPLGKRSASDSSSGRANDAGIPAHVLHELLPGWLEEQMKKKR